MGFHYICGVYKQTTMGYNEQLGYLVKDSELKLIKKMVPKIIEGNKYSRENGANGFMRLKSFRKYTWSEESRRNDPTKSQYVTYRYYAEFEFVGTFTLWGITYNEKNFKYLKAYRKKMIHRELKSIGSDLIKECMSILSLNVNHWDVNITSVKLKN